MTPILSKAHWYVYALKDPRDGSIRYVGTTINLHRRMKRHLRERNRTPKCAWVRELQTLNLEPEVEILESGDGDNAGQDCAEQRWIGRYEQSGLLLNASRRKYRRRACVVPEVLVEESDLQAAMESVHQYFRNKTVVD